MKGDTEGRRYPPRDKQPCPHCDGSGWIAKAEPEWPVKP